MEPTPEMRVLLRRRLGLITNEVDALQELLAYGNLTDDRRAETAAELLTAQASLDVLREIVRGLGD